MLCRVLAALAVAMAAAPAMAEHRYDRRIEQAAVRIVAARMGGIRGSLKSDVGPVFVRAPNPDPARRAMIERVWLKGGPLFTAPAMMGAWSIRVSQDAVRR